MADTIRHQGIVENINGTHLQVRIVQTSACASCSIKGHCSSADTKEKLIDVIDESSSYQRRPCMGCRRIVYGGNGGFACVCTSFSCFNLLPFCFYGYVHDELVSALCSLGLLIPYYYILWLNKSRLGKKFSFSIKPMN